ncbi:hypothetical protein [Neisseria elongata]|uniref:Uncharacterized protein n=1 Tax=Neisseria elongata subsp. nitroreducens TaxID=90367 RepID=A0A9X0ZS73_NEIEL|nr:hypothetical protein [Neisseria elongata]MBS9340063.1 hypothetical protein [Neisseria elongata subsp. nitroreducens]
MKEIKKDGDAIAISVKEFVYIAKYIAAAAKQGASLNTILQELREYCHPRRTCLKHQYRLRPYLSPNQGATK